jgi:hypothetical protein
VPLSQATRWHGFISSTSARAAYGGNTASGSAASNGTVVLEQRDGHPLKYYLSMKPAMSGLAVHPAIMSVCQRELMPGIHLELVALATKVFTGLQVPCKIVVSVCHLSTIVFAWVLPWKRRNVNRADGVRRELEKAQHTRGHARSPLKYKGQPPVTALFRERSSSAEASAELSVNCAP